MIWHKTFLWRSMGSCFVRCFEAKKKKSFLFDENSTMQTPDFFWVAIKPAANMICRGATCALMRRKKNPERFIKEGFSIMKSNLLTAAQLIFLLFLFCVCVFVVFTSVWKIGHDTSHWMCEWKKNHIKAETYSTWKTIFAFP